MSDLASLMQSHRAATLGLFGTLLLITAAFSGSWLRQDLRDGVTWMGGHLSLNPSRADMPELYWFAIICHIGMTALLALSGIALLVWATIVAK
jgi:hypothetical protein